MAIKRCTASSEIGGWGATTLPVGSPETVAGPDGVQQSPTYFGPAERGHAHSFGASSVPSRAGIVGHDPRARPRHNYVPDASLTRTSPLASSTESIAKQTQWDGV